MPKMKTHSGLKKRLKKTASGKLKRGHAYVSHLSHNKTHKITRESSLVSNRLILRRIYTWQE